jgi:cation:H+ antiporter
MLARRGLAPRSFREQETPRGRSKAQKHQEAQSKRVSPARAAVVFSVAALVTLAGGVIIEQRRETIAGKTGMSGVLFGSTFLAAISRPEVSTGLTSVRLGDYKIAVNNVFGGNAFLPVLFLMASLISGKAVLPQAQATDIYLTGLGILLTAGTSGASSSDPDTGSWAWT